MSSSRLPASFFLSQQLGKEYSGICLWSHGQRYLLEILDRIYQDASIESLRIIRVSHWSWAASLAWIYLFDNSKMSHLAAKTRYLRSRRNHFYFILLSTNKSGASQVFGDLKNRLRLEFSSKLIPAAGEHDHLFHMTDNTFDAQRLYMRFEDEENFSTFYKKDNFLSQRLSPELLVESSSREIQLGDCEASLLSMNTSILRPTIRVPLEQTPHVSFARGDESPYRNYVMKHLGKGLRYPHSPLRFRELLHSDAISRPITVRSTDAGKFVILDGLHRCAAALVKGKERIDARVV